MSLSPWDPFYSRRTIAPWRRSYFGGAAADPFQQAVNMMDRFFDDSMNVQLRDHAAQMQINEEGDLNYKVDVSGFRPEELNVEVQGNEIVVSGEHREQNQGESVHRQFIRRVQLPEGIQKDSVKCDLDNAGRLCICAKQSQEGRRPIPIEFKKGGQGQQSNIE